MEYHKTKDIRHVKHVLGHKCLQSALALTHLIDFKDDEYVFTIAKMANEVYQMVHTGLVHTHN
jgi:hypothetical protein